MTERMKQLAVLLAGSMLLAGCASSGAATLAPSNTVPRMSMTPGMVMPDGSTMGAGTTSARKAETAKPSAAALMICAAETRSDIRTVLAIKQAPVGVAKFADHLYTCTYHLALLGTLILSVKQSPDAASAGGYYTSLRKRLGHTTDLAGLGTAAFGTSDGTVVLRKDNDVLRVDATRMPAQFGTQQAKRNDFAYEIASDILGCWTDG
jgi:hypothetical protein